MPAPKIITKKIILNSAFELVRQSGPENLSARNLAKHIGCSTQPIYSCYSNMQELNIEVVKIAMQFALDHFLLPKDENEFIQIGLGYIKLAKKERNIFNLLFLTKNNFTKNILDIWKENEGKLISNMKKDLFLKGLNEKILHKILKNMRTYSHGLATIVYTSPDLLSDEEIFNSLTEMGKITIEWELSNQANQLIRLDKSGINS